jgi:hypothetical protein
MCVLLGDVKPSVGIPIEETPDCYMDRTLQYIQYVRPGTRNESDLLLLFRMGNVEGLKFFSACMENNC